MTRAEDYDRVVIAGVTAPSRPVSISGEPSRDLLTVDEAAAYLRVTPKAMRHMIDRGQVPVVRIGRRVRVRREELRKVCT